MNAVGSEACCPFCGSPDVEFTSLFGQQLLTVQYYCNHCRTPFERVKGDEALRDAQEYSEGEDQITSGAPRPHSQTLMRGEPSPESVVGTS